MGWDKRIWKLGLVSGNLAGLLLVLGDNSQFRRPLESMFPVGIVGYYTGELLIFASVLLDWLILPALLSGTARCLCFAWGFLPPCLWFRWLAVEGVTANHNIWSHRSDVLLLLLAMIACVSVTSGAVSLIRLFVRGFRRRHRIPIAAGYVDRPAGFAQRIWRYSGLFAIIAAGVFAFQHGWWIREHRFDGRHIHQILHVEQSNDPVRVPFTLEEGAIWVKVNVGGRIVLGQV